MATYGYVHITHKEGLRLMDLMGVRHDLNRCIAMTDAILTHSYDQTVRDALAVAILTIYGRIFLGGVRNEVKVPASHLLDTEELTLHRKFLETRSKHVVHSINSMENPGLRVWLNPEERGGRKVNNVNADLVMLITLGMHDYQLLRSFCVKMLVWVDNEEKVEQSRLKGLIEREYTLDQLYRMQANKAASGDLDDSAGGRSR